MTEAATELERLTFCLKCNKPFEASWLNTLKAWSRVCNICLMKDIFSGGEYLNPTTENSSHD